MSMVEYRNLKVMLDREILSIEQLDIKEGKRYAIVGPSGSGKSTFLRVTNLLQTPTIGSMTILGETMTEKGISRKKVLGIQRQMVYVSQKPVMFDLTVAENLAMGLKFRGVAQREIVQQVDHCLAAVGLSGYSERRATTLSGGEAQRIALARALILKPRILLLDEPTSNLDPTNIQIIEEAVKQIHELTGVTILMVTHNLQQARRMGDEIIFIYQGKIVEMQEKEPFFQTPRTQELSDFISGRMIY